MKELSLIAFTPEQRALAEEALSLPAEPLQDEAGNVRPLFALADLLRQLPGLCEQYAAHGISEQVLRDTLTDIPIWMDACKRETGQGGLRNHRWLSNHFSFQIFRLGRLQFKPAPSQVPAYAYQSDGGEVITLAREGDRFTQAGEADGTNGIHDPDAWTAVYRPNAPRGVEGMPIRREGLAENRLVTLARDAWRPVLSPGDPILEIHVPEGEPLNQEMVRQSLRAAPGFFKAHFNTEAPRAFTCGSWLLDWALPSIAPGSNVAAFQALFYCVPYPGGDGQTMERVYGSRDIRPGEGPRGSSLQRAIAAWYEKGNRCRDAWGYILIPCV